MKDLFLLMNFFVALKGFPTGKAPGSDGLPAEFYITFWDDIGDSLSRVLNESFRLGILIESQRGSLLRLIHNKDDMRYVCLKIGALFLF